MNTFSNFLFESIVRQQTLQRYVDIWKGNPVITVNLSHAVAGVAGAIKMKRTPHEELKTLASSGILALNYRLDWLNGQMQILWSARA